MKAWDGDSNPSSPTIPKVFIFKIFKTWSAHFPSKQPHHYRPFPHLDPALRARLQSALQRPDLKPTTRAKIEALLNPRKPHILPTAEHGSPEQ